MESTEGAATWHAPFSPGLPVEDCAAWPLAGSSRGPHWSGHLAQAQEGRRPPGKRPDVVCLRSVLGSGQSHSLRGSHCRPASLIYSGRCRRRCRSSTHWFRRCSGANNYIHWCSCFCPSRGLRSEGCKAPLQLHKRIVERLTVGGEGKGPALVAAGSGLWICQGSE